MRLSVIAAPFVGLTLACSDALGPDAFAGRYQLHRVGPETLPTVLYVAGNDTGYVLAHTFLLGDDGGGTVAAVIEHRGAAGVDTVAWDRPVRLAVVAEGIEITIVCGPLELCTPGPHYVGRHSAEGLLVHAAGDARPWYFVRD